MVGLDTLGDQKPKETTIKSCCAISLKYDLKPWAPPSKSLHLIGQVFIGLNPLDDLWQMSAALRLLNLVLPSLFYTLYNRKP